MKRPVIVVDHPLLAEALAAFLTARAAAESSSLPVTQLERAPSRALVLLEILLPRGICGLSMAHGLLESRPDLTPIVWSVAPKPLYLWAGTYYRLPAFLDKEMEPIEFLHGLTAAADDSTAWPLPLLTTAREWGETIARRLRTLRPDHWRVWLAMLKGYASDRLASDLNLSKRTVQRRQEELYQLLGASGREELSPLAWQWGLVRAGRDIEWAPIVPSIFDLSDE